MYWLCSICAGGNNSTQVQQPAHVYHSHQIVGQLIIKEKRCCHWIQCMTNSASVYISALPEHLSPCCNLPAFALMMERQRRRTLKLGVIDAFKEMHISNHSDKKKGWEVDMNTKKWRLRRTERKTNWEPSATQFPKLWKEHIFHLNANGIASEVSKAPSPPTSACHSCSAPSLRSIHWHESQWAYGY